MAVAKQLVPQPDASQYGDPYETTPIPQLSPAARPPAASPGGGVSAWGMPLGQVIGPQALVAPQSAPISPPAAPVLTPPPGGESGVTQGIARDPRDEALAQQLFASQMPGGGATHPLGYSKADKEMLQYQVGRGQETQEEAAQALAAQEALAAEQHQNLQAATAESQAAAAKAQGELADNQERHKALVAAAKDRQSRIDSELAKMQAHGIDPNSYYQSQSTPAKIAAAMAVAAGAFGAHALGPRGGSSQNYALQIIDGAISQEIDAQKFNAQRSIDLMAKRMGLEESGFNRDLGMLHAERDSVMTGYTIAAQEAQRRAGLVAQDSEAQKNLLAQRDLILNRRDEKTDALTANIYQMQKRAETPVGVPGSGILQKVNELSLKIQEDARKAGLERTPAEADRLAFTAITHQDIKPGEPLPSFAAPKSAGRAAGRLLGPITDLETTADALSKLKKIYREAGMGPLGPEKMGEVKSLVEHAKRGGVDLGEPTRFRLTNETLGRVIAAETGVKEAIAHKRAALANAPSAAAEAETPEGMTAEEDEP